MEIPAYPGHLIHAAIALENDAAAHIILDQNPIDGKLLNNYNLSGDLMDADFCKLIKSDEFKSILSSSMDGFLLVDSSGRLLEVNNAYSMLSGYSRDELLGMCVSDLDVMDRQDDVRKRMQRIIRTGSERFETEHRRKDGSIVQLEISVAYSKTHGGHFHSFVRNIADLKRSEERYRRFATLTSDYIYMCQRNGSEPFRVKWMAGAIEAITGYSPDEILAKGCWLLLVVSDDRERVAECLRRIKPGDAISEEFRINTKSGATRWIRESCRCEAGEDPGHVMLYGSARDVTEQKIAEISLRDSELFLREAQRVAHLGIYDYNITEDVWTSSPEMDSMFGIDKTHPHDFAGWLALIHPDYRNHMDAYFSTIVTAKKWFDMEYKIVRPSDGEERWVYGTGEFTFDTEGDPVRLIGTIQDITERKVIEQQLKKSEERFRSIMSLSPDIISIIDKDGVLTYNSPAALAIHGYSADELIGRNTFELIHPDDQPHVNTAFTALLAHPSEVVIVQYRYRNKNGNYTWMEATGSNQFNNPLVDGIVCISRNIEDRKKIEEQRLGLERNLLHAQKLESLGILAGGIAHDFNNLLAAILGNLDLALLRLPPGSPVHENIEQSMKASRRAADLTRQMLAYSGKGVFQLKSLDLNEIVTGNTDLFRTVIPRNITLAVETNDDLPQIMADPGQIQQVVMNMITNASEAIGAHQGSISLATGSLECDEECIQKSVLVERPSPGRFVYVEVSDNGCGMGEETKHRLFDPFFTTKFTGRGLGMAATQGIVRSHQGVILLESEEGKGTTFRILFPVTAAKATQPHQQDNLPPMNTTLTTDRKGIVLVVDDEDLVRSLGVNYVQFFGFESLEAGNGAEALDLFRQHANDIVLVILDLTMPVMDGVAAFGELKKIKPDVRVILSSGFSEQSVAEQFPKERPDAFIQKPFQIRELEDKINQLLNDSTLDSLP